MHGSLWHFLIFTTKIALFTSAFRVNVTIETNMHLQSLFIEYQNKYGVLFRNKAAQSSGMKTFSETVEFITAFNAQEKNTYKQGLNKFSHLSWSEFKDQYLMKNGSRFFDPTEMQNEVRRYPHVTFFKATGQSPTFVTELMRASRRLQSVSNIQKSLTPVLSLPSWVNWRRYATVVKDQMRCSSCYAFAGVGTYEVLINLKYNRQFTMSEQEIMDCSPYANGCIGGNPADVFLYASQNGLGLMSNYPYTAKVGTCKQQSRDQKVYTNVKYRYLNPDIFTILTAVAAGPVSIIHAASKNFKNYQSGVFSDPTCNGELDHSATCIGYDLNAPIPYLYFKNAWGTDWGEGGYYKLAIGDMINSNKGTCLMMSHNYNAQPYF